MGNSLRCCLACALPFGALDVVRIVHLNGHVEEYGRQVSAGEVMAANPNHIISKPCSRSQGITRKIMILSPDYELRRGHLYFLIPESSFPNKDKKKKKKSHKKKSHGSHENIEHTDNYLTEVLSEKKAGCHHRRRSSRLTVWRPHLESILEES